jgi:hypothetical protein
MKNISIYDRIDLWRMAAMDINIKQYSYDNVLICLVSQLKEIYQKSVLYGLSPSEFNNGNNIYLLMLNRTSFLNKNKDNEKA